MFPIGRYWENPLSILSSVPVMLRTISTASRRSGLMVLLCGMTVAGLPFADRPARAQPAAARMWDDDLAVDTFAPFVVEASQRFAIPASWIRAIVRAESGGDVHAVSRKGAIGLMQLMPETWSELRARYGFGGDLYDPHDNILAGAAYLRELFDRYGSAGFLAAYNAGPARYEELLRTGRALPDETRAYIAMLAPAIAGEQVDGAPVVATVVSLWTEAPLFVGGVSGGAADSNAMIKATGKQRSNERMVTLRPALLPQSNGLFVRSSTWSPLL